MFLWWKNKKELEDYVMDKRKEIINKLEGRDKLKEKIMLHNRSLYTGILLWFLSDGIEVDEKRLARMFNETEIQLLKEVDEF